jgi:hypothetical protein
MRRAYSELVSGTRFLSRRCGRRKTKGESLLIPVSEKVDDVREKIVSSV